MCFVLCFLLLLLLLHLGGEEREGGGGGGGGGGVGWRGVIIALHNATHLSRAQFSESH